MHFHSVLLHVSDQHFLSECYCCEVVLICAAREVAVHQISIAVPLGDGNPQGTAARMPRGSSHLSCCSPKGGPAGASIPRARSMCRG